MTEVSPSQAGNVLGISLMTIHRRVEDGSLPARREGVRRDIKIALDDLRQFATTFGYRFDESIAAELSRE